MHWVTGCTKNLILEKSKKKDQIYKMVVLEIIVNTDLEIVHYLIMAVKYILQHQN